MKSLRPIIATFGILSFVACSDRDTNQAEEQVTDKMEAQEWPFDQAQNVAAITTRQVIEDNKPILMVIHYSDDDSWAFLCNTSGAESDGRVICMSTALNLDPTLRSIAGLPPGWIAERDSVGSDWRKTADPDY